MAHNFWWWSNPYNDVIMGAIASQITSLRIVCSTVYSDVDQRKHQSSATLAFVRWIHRGPVNSPHKWPVTRKMFPFDDVIMRARTSPCILHTQALHSRILCQYISMAYCKNAVTPLLTHWRYCRLVLSRLSHWEIKTALTLPINNVKCMYNSARERRISLHRP